MHIIHRSRNILHRSCNSPHRGCDSPHGVWHNKPPFEPTATAPEKWRSHFLFERRFTPSDPHSLLFERGFTLSDPHRLLFERGFTPSDPHRLMKQIIQKFRKPGKHFRKRLGSRVNCFYFFTFFQKRKPNKLFLLRHCLFLFSVLCS